ncbi:MAG: hypothetical protein HY519_02490, partial [Candidatus Aenigmarchaeota archaeon]|nr:hypothetical protein [Candidatus Aenigmarchaeota archaeon]
FSTLLGSNIAINLTFGEDYYVEMVVSGETFSPRYRIATAPYAFRANITTTAIAGTTTEPSFVVNSISGQVSNLTEWRNSAGAIVASLNTSGYFNVTGGIPCTAIRGGDDFCQDENATGSVSDNTTQSNLITGNNNTLYALLGQRLNLTGGILSGLLSILGINTANNLSLNVNNTLYVNASLDRVGIGTSSPSSKLDVSGTLTVEGINVTGRQISDNTTLGNKITTLQSDNTTQTALLGQKLNLTGGRLQGDLIINATGNANGTNSYNSSDLTLQGSGVNYTNTSLNPNVTLRNIVTNAGSANRLGIFVNESERVSIDSAGQVGIGTTSPSSKLDVSGTLTVEGVNVTGRQASDNTTIAGNLTTTNARVGNLETKEASDNTTQANLITGNNNTLLANLGQKLNLTGGTLSSLLSILGASLANNLSLNANNTLYVNASLDRVGIGTSSPGSKLEVVGTANITGGLNVSAGGLNVVGGNAGIGTTAPNQALHVSGGNVNVSSGNLWVTGALVINGTPITGTAAAGWTENTDTTSVFNDTPNVKVGIGTASPIAKLTVNGTNTANNLSLNINNTLYVNASADRVGIGTATPSSKLDVSGTLTVEGVNVTGREASDNTTQEALLGQKLNLTGGIISGLFQVGNVSALNNVSVNLSNSLYVNSSRGYTGIGTANPTQKLEISGGNVNVSGGNVWIEGDLIINGTPYASTNVSILYGANASNTTSVIPAQISTQGNLMVSIDEGLGTGWSASAALVFLQTASDRVGIGTATPLSKLDITGGNTANNLSFIANSTVYLNNSGGGLVGIRTASPASVLDIYGNASISGTLLVNGVNISGGQAADNTTLANRIEGNNNTLYAVAGQKLNLTGGILSGLFQVGNVSALNNISVNLSSALYVNSTLGWVGINKANPSTMLDVSGTLTVEGVNVTGRQTSDNTTTFALLGQKVNLTGGTLSGLLSITGNAANAGNLSLSVNSTLYVNQSTSNVGIGTSSPGSKLEVVGTANITGGLNVSAGGLNVVGGNAGIG